MPGTAPRSEEHTSELQSRSELVCRLLLEKKNRVAALAVVQLIRVGHKVAARTVRDDHLDDPRDLVYRVVGRVLHPPQVLVGFFFNDAATTEIYTLSLHDALPI